MGPGQECHGVAVLDGNSFGLARRAGCVNHVSEIVRRGITPRIGGAFLGDQLPIPVQAYPVDGLTKNGRLTIAIVPSRSTVPKQAFLSEENRHLSICQHELQTLRGIAGIERYVTA